MIWVILLIISLSVILFLFIKKIPSIRSVDISGIKNKINFTKKATVRASEIKKVNINEDSKFAFFAKPATSEENLFDEADMLFKHGNYNEAEKLYVKIATINPKNVKVYNRLGILYMQKKNHADAKEAFLMAVKLDPKKASRHYNLATAYEELKEYRNAQESLEKALNLDKDNKKYKKYLVELKEKVEYRYKEMKRTED